MPHCHHVNRYKIKKWSSGHLSLHLSESRVRLKILGVKDGGGAMSNDGTNNSTGVCVLVVFTSRLGDAVHVPYNIKIADSCVCVCQT